MTTQTQLTKEEVRDIARGEIRNRESENYFYTLITGQTFENQVMRHVQDKVPALVSTEVDKDVQKYLRRHLEDEVRSRLLSVLPLQLPPLVKGEILERLSSMAGVTPLLEEHQGKIETLLKETRTEFRQERAGHLQNLQEVTKRLAQDFEKIIVATAQRVVDELVGSNGAVLKGFRDSLEKKNEEDFKVYFRNLNTIQTTFREQYDAQISRLQLITGGLALALGGLLLFTIFK